MTCEGTTVPGSQAEFEAQLKVFEGNVPHMYLDTAGKVTIGVGIMLANKASAARLKYTNRETGRPASIAEVDADFASVELSTPGKPAAFYKPRTRLDGDADRLELEFQKRLGTAKADAQAFFPQFDALLAGNNAPVAYAVWDMAFNLGARKLALFVHFHAALERNDWATAAAESHRRGVQDDRNEAIRCWLLLSPQPKPPNA